ASYPCGIAANADESRLYVCLSRNNTLAEIEIASGKIIREIPVGVAPYAVTLSPKGDIAYVSVWGGRPPVKGEREADSSGTPTRVDERGVALRGGVSFIDLTVGKSIALTETGRHAGALALSLDGKSLYVANANDDTVSIVNAASHRILKTFTVRQDTVLPYGSQPNALALSTDGAMLYIACGGNNAVASLNLVAGKIQGWIPAGWYPGALLIKEGTLYIASTKGFGSRGEPANKDTKGMNVYQYLGVLQRMNTPSDREYATLTAQALADSRMVDAQRDREKRRLDAVHVPVPERVGEPSSIKRIVYIIKENRTYDQVFGDLKQGDGDPSLCLYGRKITPNHHALAEQFVLLDNFYCNGVLSADGHSWATEGNNTDHLEKAFGGFTRSYTFGDDALTYSSTGFLWDKILDKGLSFRNYGEMDYTDEKPDVSYAAILKDWQDKTGKITFTHKIGIERLKKHSSPDAPGWNMDIPDVVRADVFLRDLKKWEKSGELPNLTILYLPNDHTTGTTPGDPTPQAYLADNDLALGRVVEGVTRSRFWKDACIFVVEDDPQAGFDHVDGHRSLCLVISPYTRRGVVISDFYNQTSVLHTIGRILGVSAMNQQDAAAPLMT
ncbi:MAG: bifunctional YncE family protein/alkaline phosphatase family protein, partial [bacterium]